MHSSTTLRYISRMHHHNVLMNVLQKIKGVKKCWPDMNDSNDSTTLRVIFELVEAEGERLERAVRYVDITINDDEFTCQAVEYGPNKRAIEHSRRFNSAKYQLHQKRNTLVLVKNFVSKFANNESGLHAVGGD